MTIREGDENLGPTMDQNQRNSLESIWRGLTSKNADNDNGKYGGCGDSHKNRRGFFGGGESKRDFHQSWPSQRPPRDWSAGSLVGGRAVAGATRAIPSLSSRVSTSQLDPAVGEWGGESQTLESIVVLPRARRRRGDRPLTADSGDYCDRPYRLSKNSNATERSGSYGNFGDFFQKMEGVWPTKSGEAGSHLNQLEG